jgi:quinol monooxygenase YgiN
MVDWRAGSLVRSLRRHRPVVQVFVTLSAPPERLHDTVQAIRALMLPAQLERGCTRAQLYSEVGAPGAICYMEEWSDAADLVKQVRSSRFTRMLALVETAVEQPVVEFRFVSDVRGLDYIAAVRSEASVPGGQ